MTRDGGTASTRRRGLFGRRHKHNWYVTAVQVEHFNSGDRTNVLHRCDCGKAKVEVLDGGWRAESLGLKPKPETTP